MIPSKILVKSRANHSKYHQTKKNQYLTIIQAKSIKFRTILNNCKDIYNSISIEHLFIIIPLLKIYWKIIITTIKYLFASQSFMTYQHTIFS